MIKSQELSGPSCLTKAADDEPLFVLRANDELAPGIVEAWADDYVRVKANQPGGMSAVQRQKYRDALAIAMAMREWKQRQQP
jgi:hypothetical protein